MKRNFYGQVKNNKLEIDQKHLFLNEIKRFDGKKIVLSLEVYCKQRSNRQNRYYWGVIIPMLAEEFGYSNMETHEALKFQFLRIQTEGKPDTCKSTTSLNISDFEAYLITVREWAHSQWEVQIPLPNEIDLPEFYEMIDE